ncbi:MAG: hypothetical protein U0Z44_22405 [Kouleothrix sp.]
MADQLKHLVHECDRAHEHAVQFVPNHAKQARDEYYQADARYDRLCIACYTDAGEQGTRTDAGSAWDTPLSFFGSRTLLMPCALAQAA